MNYKKIYDNLIDRGKRRTSSEYFESHHIIPKCVGGTDEVENLVKLTPEEHYVAHQLLSKIYKHNPKLVYAATMMVANRQTNKMYGWIRRRLSKATSDNQSGSGNSQYGTFWIFNEEIQRNRKIKANESIPYGWQKGRVYNWNIDKTSEKLLRKSLKDDTKREQFQQLWEKFLNGSYTSIRDFAKKEYDKSHVYLTKNWKKYIGDYKEVKQGIPYSPN